jgi:tRNA threonylcarbamoyladenosine modification (KEOPS) complex  Pcc1 subunit
VWEYGVVGNVDTLLQVEHTSLQLDLVKQVIVYEPNFLRWEPVSSQNFSKVSANIEITLSDEIINIVKESLLPETETPSSDRSSVELNIVEGGLILVFNASDISALRAAMNSYLRWIQGIINMFNVID